MLQDRHLSRKGQTFKDPKQQRTRYPLFTRLTPITSIFRSMPLLRKWPSLSPEEPQTPKSRCFKLNDKLRTTFLKQLKKSPENENWCKHSPLRNGFFQHQNNQNLTIHYSIQQKRSSKLPQCTKMKKNKKKKFHQL